MAEAESLSSKLTIPENWNFPDRYDRKTAVKIINVDESQGYLAFLSKRRGSGVVQAELFFDDKGNLSSERKVRTFRDAKFLVTVRLFSPQGQLAFAYRNFPDDKEGLSSVFTVYLPEGNENLKLVAHGFNSVPICSEANFNFRGELIKIDTGDEFMENGDKEKPSEAPRLSLEWEGKGFDLVLFPSAKKERPEVEEIDQNRIVVRHETGNGPFECAWRKEQGIIILNQKHIPSKTIKVLRIPLHVDTAKIKELLLTGQSVDAPWRRIDELATVNVSYFRLLDSETKSKPQG